MALGGYRLGNECLSLQPAGTIVELDTDAGRVVVRRQTKAGDYPQARLRRGV